MPSLRERAIAEYHELLAADETLTPATFEKLRSAMRKKRLLYGDRPIGVALRPHFLDHEQFRALTLLAERVTSALEKVAAAVAQDPNLMNQLGLTEAERNMALVDPGFSTAVRSRRQNQICRIQCRESFESAGSGGTESIALRAACHGEVCPTLSFTSVLPSRETARNAAEYLSRMGRLGRAEHRHLGLEGPAYVE